MSAEAAFVEAVPIEGLARHEAAWRTLSDRAAEPNIFAESAFLIPALRRLRPSRILALLIWRDASRQALIGLVALRGPSLGGGLARIWLCEQAALAAMSFDRDALAQALDGLLAWLRRHRAGVAGVVLPRVDATGPYAAALRELAAQQRLRRETLDSRRRAALSIGGAESFETALDKKRRKEWARQARRLAERGKLEARAAHPASGVERFLALEAKGWKGGRGTALNANPARLAFAREMLEACASRGQVAFDELVLDGDPMAMGIVLRSGVRAFYWKTAYDERFAEYSPGVQLTLALSRRLERARECDLVDSCALQDHPMIDRLWPGRLEFVDIALSTQGPAGWRFAAALAGERARLTAREQAKHWLHRLRGGKRS